MPVWSLGKSWKGNIMLGQRQSIAYKKRTMFVFSSGGKSFALYYSSSSAHLSLRSEQGLTHRKDMIVVPFGIPKVHQRKDGDEEVHGKLKYLEIGAGHGGRRERSLRRRPRRR